MKNNYKKLVLVFILFISLKGRSQQWEWLKDVNSPAFGVAIAAGVNGDAYGIISRNYTFNLERYDSTGSLLWQKPYGVFYDLRSYSNGDLFAWGQLYKNTKIRNTILPGDMNTKPAVYARLNQDADSVLEYFTMKIDNHVSRIDVNSAGETFLLGDIKDTINIKGQLMINSGPVQKKYIAKLSPTFNLLWYKFIETDGYITGMAAHGNNMVLVGNSGKTLMFNNSVIFTSNYNHNAFVLEVDLYANVIWNKVAKGAMNPSVGTDSFNNVNISGGFLDSMRFETGYFYRPCGPNTCGESFVSKLDAAGNLKWITFIGAQGNEPIYNVGFTPQGTIWFSGEVNHKLYVGSDSIYDHKNFNFNWNPFFAKLDQNGKLAWWDVPINNSCAPITLAPSANGDMFWSGFANQLILGSDTVSSVYSNTYSCFITKLSDNATATLNNEIKISKTDIILYPNPSAGKIYLDHYPPEGKICVYDMSGRCVYRSNANELIDLSGKEKGVYILELSSAGKMDRCKLILE